MASNTQIADRSNKRFNGKAKTSDSRAFFEEPYSIVDKINPSHIWLQRDLIPNTPSGFTPTNGEEVGVVRYNNVTLTLVTGTTKAFYNALLADIIPFDYGDGTSYDWELSHSVEGTIVKGQGDWEVIDGVLVFNGTLPFSGGTLTMSFYSYIGQKADKYKGYFVNSSALTTDYPNGIGTASDRAGWFAMVASSFYTWSISNNQWELLSGGIADVVDDTTPQLGGDLDLNGHGISYASGIVITDALDEDDMSSDSSTAVPTQQSAKAYADNGDEKVSQTFTNVADTNFTIDFNSEDFTINRHITSITGNLTCTVSNAVSGSQFVIDVSVASGETNHELIFSGPSSPTIIPDFVNGTSDGLIFGGSSSAATKYTAIGWYNGTEWRINVIDWN